MNSRTQPFSVCMSVYKNDNPAEVRAAVLSVFHQTVPPDEIILVIDGPIAEDLQHTIHQLQQTVPPLQVLPLPQNQGHAVARQIGLQTARHELVAVMDADDLSVPDRFEQQLKAFAQHPETSVVGGLIHEFTDTPEHVISIRHVAEQDDAIKRDLKSRAPMNLVTVMVRKRDVMEVGGYMDWFCEEDYYLWIRLALAGRAFYNIQRNLVFVRVNPGTYKRRGGMRYFRSEAGIQRYMWQRGLISFPRLTYNVTIRFLVQVVLPNTCRSWVFKHFARQ